MEELSKKKCVPCEGSAKPLDEDRINQLRKQIKNWKICENHHLSKKFKFADFNSALDFINKIAKICDVENHHPNIEFSWGYAIITIYTHAIDGLSENDFILASKIDKIS